MSYSTHRSSTPVGQLSIYEEVGGGATIRRLVEAFYPKVYANPELRPLFPDGVDEIKEKQYLFLTQFSGGPLLYTDTYGFGNMRAIHQQFPVTAVRAEAWLGCMKQAMDEIGLGGPARHRLFGMLTQAAHRFVNTEASEV